MWFQVAVVVNEYNGCIWLCYKYVLSFILCLCVQVQATDADQGENGRVLYKILSGEYNFPVARWRYFSHLLAQKQVHTKDC